MVIRGIEEDVVELLVELTVSDDSELVESRGMRKVGFLREMPTVTALSRANRRGRLPRVIRELTGVGSSRHVVVDEEDEEVGIEPATTAREADRFTNRVIHVKEISVEFIKTRPISDLELVFKDDAGVKSYKFKNGAIVHWDLDIYVNTHTSATLTIQRELFKIRVAKVSVEFKPYKFGDDKVVRLEDSNHRVTVTFVHRKSKSVGLWLFSGARKPSNFFYSWQTSLAFLTLRPPSQTPSLQRTPSNPVVEFQKSSSEYLL
ncbi:hypothetical protein EDB84DRAFT_1443344 [Lactarius hengduanensis]|nr:hypothetical protein EDB84DRAFT_1443344 [Lactarius hengduanensis]